MQISEILISFNQNKTSVSKLKVQKLEIETCHSPDGDVSFHM